LAHTANAVVSNWNIHDIAVYLGRLNQTTKYTELIFRVYFSTGNKIILYLCKNDIYQLLVFNVIHVMSKLIIFCCLERALSIYPEQGRKKSCTGVFHQKSLSCTGNYVRKIVFLLMAYIWIYHRNRNDAITLKRE
jgi:hypothetical protein